MLSAPLSFEILAIFEAPTHSNFFLGCHYLKWGKTRIYYRDVSIYRSTFYKSDYLVENLFLQIEKKIVSYLL